MTSIPPVVSLITSSSAMARPSGVAAVNLPTQLSAYCCHAARRMRTGWLTHLSSSAQLADKPARQTIDATRIRPRFPRAPVKRKLRTANFGLTGGHVRNPQSVRSPQSAVVSYIWMFSRNWKLRGRPTDAPLKNAPFSKYFLSKMLST